MAARIKLPFSPNQLFASAPGVFLVGSGVQEIGSAGVFTVIAPGDDKNWLPDIRTIGHDHWRRRIKTRRRGIYPWSRQDGRSGQEQCCERQSYCCVFHRVTSKE
jgi:hypothetical protein